jgi:hypothetical protein
MLAKLGRAVLTVSGAVALTLLLQPEPVHAQGLCGQQQSRLSPGGMRRQNGLAQLTALSQQNPMQQGAQLVAWQLQQLQQQQQLANLVALQLQQLQQQNAMLMALQQQQQQGQPPQNAQLAVQRRAMQRGPQPTPEIPAADPQPQDPEAAAARKLAIARELVADASRAQFQGDGDGSTRMRQRAVVRLQEVVAQYSGTRAADRAQDLLDRLTP